MRIMLFEDFINKEDTNLNRKEKELENITTEEDLKSDEESNNHKKSTEVINIPGWDQY